MSLINLCNIDFNPGGGSASLQEKTAEMLLSETSKEITPDSGYDGMSKVTVTHAPVQNSKSVTITSNGTQTITPDTDYDAVMQVIANINVSGGSDYRIKNGSITGLADLGWNTASQGYANFNLDPHYTWKNSEYVVSQANKDLYGVINDANHGNYASNTDMVYVPYFDTSSRTNFTDYFNGFSYIKGIPVFDTSNATNITNMFRGCSNLKTIPPINTSNVITADSLFYGCSNIETIPALDLSANTNFGGLFYGCSSLTDIPDIDTSAGTNFGSMFGSNINLTTIPALDLSNAVSTNNMFLNSYNLKTLPALNTVNVTNMNQMLNSTTALTTVNGINFSSLTTEPVEFFGYAGTNITHFIVNGSISFSCTDTLGLQRLTHIDYDSVKSILTAMKNCTNPSVSKEAVFSCSVIDPDSEIQDLITECTTNKGWSISGLTIVTNPGYVYYTTSDGNTLSLGTETIFVGASVMENTYSGGQGTLTLSAQPTGVYRYAFDSKQTLTSMTLPSSVTLIDQAAFRNCLYLTSITAPGVTTIGNYAFQDCQNLTSIDLSNVTSVGDQVFYLCKLSSVSLPVVTTIGYNAFYYQQNSSLTSLTIGDAVTSIGDSAFNDNYSLADITISATTPPSLGSSVFPFNTGMIIKVPNASISTYKTEWSDYADYIIPMTQSGTEIFYISTDGNTVQPYDSTAFGGRTIQSNVLTGNFGIITFDGTVTEVGDNAFKEVQNYSYMSLSSSVTTIGDYAFQNTGASNIICPGITSVGDYAFNTWNMNYSNINVNNLTSIGEYAFYGCYGVKGSVTINSALTTISQGAFDYCQNLSSLTISSGVTTIENYAFSNCTNLTSISIPATVTSIGSYSFNNVTNVSTITVDPANTYYSNEGNNLIEISTNTLMVGTATSVIPSTVTRISDYAFANKAITSVTLPSGLTYIGERAFSQCNSLSGSITIPAGVTYIGYYAFRGCINLSGITVDSSNTTYDSRDNCNGIVETAINKMIAATNTSVIPSTVTTIGPGCFYGMTFSSINIPSSVTTIGSEAFGYCNNLTSIDLNNVTSVNSSAFFQCSSLTSITMNNVTDFGWGVFYLCSSLTTVTIPSSVTVIGNQCFEQCSSLAEVICNPTSVPTMNGPAFEYNAEGRLIKVPAASLTAYQTASNWSNYASSIVSQ